MSMFQQGSPSDMTPMSYDNGYARNPVDVPRMISSFKKAFLIFAVASIVFLSALMFSTSAELGVRNKEKTWCGRATNNANMANAFFVLLAVSATGAVITGIGCVSH